MKRRLTSIFLSLLLSCVMATSAFAEFVFVTKSGKKYHHVESRYSKKDNVEKITKDEAEARGLTPSKDYIRRQKKMETADSKKTSK